MSNLHTKNAFLHYLFTTAALIQESKSSENPAMYLYSKDARTPVFMLEGLSRLYKNLHNKKRFEKMQEKFKVLEDGLGQVDFYHSLVNSKALSGNETKDLKIYFQELLNESCTILNIILEQDYFKKDEPFFKEVKKLKSADWLSEEKETQAIAKYYNKECQALMEMGTSLPFTDLELHAHEWRRKLRWLSIYSQALNGLVQLESTSVESKWKKYMTPEIVNSPFNTFKSGDGLPYHIWLNQPAFFALSWMIQTLGDIKDEGLMQHAITRGILKLNPDMEGNDAYALAKKWCGSKMDDAQLLQKAATITKTFLEDKALNVL